MRRCAATVPPTATASGAHLARAQDRNRRRHHDGNAVAARERAEVREHQGEIAKVLRRDAALMRGALLRGDGGLQFRRRLVLDIPHHRHDQALRGIHRDREIDVIEKHARIRGGVVPGVQGGLDAPGADERANQPQHVIPGPRPRMEVGVIAHRGERHLGLRCGHAARHGAPQAAQRLPRRSGRQCRRRRRVALGRAGGTLPRARHRE